MESRRPLLGESVSGKIFVIGTVKLGSFLTVIFTENSRLISLTYFRELAPQTAGTLAALRQLFR